MALASSKLFIFDNASDSSRRALRKVPGTEPALLGVSCMPAAAFAESGAGIFLVASVDKAARGQRTQECVV